MYIYKTGVMTYFALHNKPDGQGDRGIVVEHRLVVHTVHRAIADPAAVAATIGDDDDLLLLLLDARCRGQGCGGGRGGQGRG